MKVNTRRNLEEDRQHARRIRAAGVPVVVETNKNEVPELLIHQDSEAYESTVFDVNGGTGLILPLRIIPNVGVFFFSGVDIVLDRWPSGLFRRLEEDWRGKWPHYEFYGRSAFKFHRSQTVNQAIAEQKELRPGHLCRGLLLAFSHESMPDDIVRGEALRGSIKIFDQFEREHSAKIILRAHREAERVLTPDPQRRRLLARPDSKSSL